jgi:hypothetical protein
MIDIIDEERSMKCFGESQTLRLILTKSNSLRLDLVVQLVDSIFHRKTRRILRTFFFLTTLFCCL